MYKQLISLIMLIMVCQSSEASSLRCNSRLVKEGDSAFKFRQVCGEPDDVQSTVVYRKRGIGSLIKTGKRTKVLLSDEETIAVTLEKWTYNFGSNRFMRLVTFENGKAVSIERLGRGF